jgi:DNA primase
MGSTTVDSIKERLDIVEVVSSYLKLEKAGQNFKGRCPFHTEKTPSFLVSPVRQSYYCFGCGEKGDIFSIVQQMEGVDFKGALKILADRAGVQIEYSNRGESKTEKDKIYNALEDATLFFQNELEKNSEALTYLESRGVNKDSVKEWRLGFAQNEWRSLYSNLTALGYTKEILLKAGLVKTAEGDDKDKTPYDVFRGRIIFPIFDINGRVIAFSGRALEKDTEPKYLNTPETTLFIKSEVLYGLDKAKEVIRKNNYAVLVEGQLDLVLSHQAGVKNTVASSGTAFTQLHLERLKRLSPRIILAFDGDSAGENAALKSSALSLFLDMEVKIAELPEGSDPADLAKHNPEEWKEVLRKATHAIEFVLNKIIKSETDSRKLGKAIDKKVLPMLVLLESSIERAHFVSLISKKSGIKEEVIWEDLRRAKAPDIHQIKSTNEEEEVMKETENIIHSKLERIEQKLVEVVAWKSELPEKSLELDNLNKEEAELNIHLNIARLEEERSILQTELVQAPGESEQLNARISELNRLIDVEKRKIV